MFTESRERKKTKMKNIINKIKHKKEMKKFHKYMRETVQVTYYYYYEPEKIYTENMDRIGLNNMGIYDDDVVIIKVEKI